MTEEKRPYVLYEYLLYFWKKKWFFVIIPLIMAVLVAGAVYVMKSKGKPAYTGEASIYTGSISSKDLTNDENIKAKFLNIKNLDVIVSEKGVVKFTITGKSKAQVQKSLDEVSSEYTDLLQKKADDQIATSNVYLTSLEDRVKALENASKHYQKKLDDPTTPPVEFSKLSDLIIETKKNRYDAEATAHRMRSDQVFFEKPKELTKTVHAKKTYIAQSVAIGIILGLVLTVALLILLKYLGDARRYYKQHD
ncbi:hypothetical protein RCG23_14555 [Neobacillus sp. PS3-34]|uniref:hypothetical protein n=1 Tax=Neobacillus sp. PS3-34 TaxID=3070678 RepID=UPI0027E147EC|nr:hypothetical protein [Neobacillus sp. PS3-34]WML46856.1 hypothetical protein RCG23_14555 [Neobacillus sp. PS3-34]